MQRILFQGNMGQSYLVKDIVSTFWWYNKAPELATLRGEELPKFQTMASWLNSFWVHVKVTHKDGGGGYRLDQNCPPSQVVKGKGQKSHTIYQNHNPVVSGHSWREAMSAKIGR